MNETTNWSLGPLAALASSMALACSAAPSDALGDFETIDHESTAITTFAIEQVEKDPECHVIAVSFTAAPTLPGKSLVRYTLQRARKVNGSWTPMAKVASATASSSLANDFNWISEEQYSYQIVPVYRENGSESSGTATAAVAFTPNCAVARATSGTTHPLDVYLYTPSDVAPPSNLTKEYIETLVFSEQNSGSLFNYLQDVSAGHSHTAFVPQVRIGGKVFDWKKLSKPKSGYPGKMPDMQAELRPLMLELYQANPNKRYAFIFNTGSGGGEAGGHMLSVGGNELTPATGTGIGTLAHEFGHSIGLSHELGVECPDGVLPKQLDDIESCTINTYVSGQNVMSFASDQPNYFNAVQKRRLGFITKQQTSWYDVRTLAVGSSARFTLYDSSTTQSSASKLLLLLKFDDAEDAYALQYRRAVGFDTNTVMAGTGGEIVPFPAGVFVYLAPGRKIAGLGDTQSAMLFRNSDWKQPLVVTGDAATTYYDPHRKLEITASNLTSSSASVLIRRR